MTAPTFARRDPTPADAALIGAPPVAVEDWAATLIAQQLAMLSDLAEVGMQIVRAIRDQATGQGSDEAGDTAPVVTGDVALAYARAARAVRLTLALQSRLIAQRQAWLLSTAQAAADAAKQRDYQNIFLDVPNKQRVQRMIGRVAQGQRADKETVERLMVEAAERLDDKDRYGDILERPFSEIIAAICRDLGLSPDWPRLSQEPWAQKEIADGKPGAPLAALMADPPTGAQGPPDAHRRPGGLGRSAYFRPRGPRSRLSG
jgi:hypothetical protein